MQAFRRLTILAPVLFLFTSCVLRTRDDAQLRPGPVATEAVASDPSVAAEEVPAESFAAESVAAESVAAESVAAESVAAESVAAESVAAESVAAESVARRDPQREQFERELARAYPSHAPLRTKTRSIDLRAAPTTVRQFADGRILDVWAYNGQVPGPVLRVRLGEELEVKLQNDLPQPTTIHWHGVRVPNAMDGVPGVTQDPVPPGGSFIYRFLPKDAGTFWFHPHVQTAEQVERGLYGVLVVEDAEPLPYSRDEVWVIDDWRLAANGQIDPRFVTRQDLAHDGRWGQVVTINGDSAMVMVVKPGERLRLRLLNTSNGRVYLPDFGDLAPRVIAVDGMYTGSPLDMAGITLAPGGRLDLDVVIPADASGRKIQVFDRFTPQPILLATLRVEGIPVATPKFVAPSNPNIPRWTQATDRAVDVTYVLDARLGGEFGIQWTINGRVWGEHAVTELRGGRWTRLRFENKSYRLHPMHLHGQFFKVIARGGVSVDEPYFRDTVLIRGREVVDVALVPIDWGRWMMHCHILEHAEAGMMTLIRVGDPD